MAPDDSPAVGYVHVGADERRQAFHAIMKSTGLPVGRGIAWPVLRFGAERPDPVVAIQVAAPIATSVDAVIPRIVDLWARWPKETDGELVIGGVSGTPLFVVNRWHADIGAALESVADEAKRWGNRVFIWTGTFWYHSRRTMRGIDLAQPPDQDDGGIGAGDRSPVTGLGPTGTAGAMADLPGEPG